tara:strand:+ start:241 stop:507 length:267 start_codon:yes stop_codon:yes gene_type:complete
LFEVGYSIDISTANIFGETPMLKACRYGNLHICQWLYYVGASGDISKATNYGSTPMHVACYNGHLSVCKWLILNVILTDEKMLTNDEH